MECKKVISLVGSLLICGSLFAKPPEEICDPLKESTPGLYGLCAAFCGSHPPGDSGTLELSKPQLKLLEAYNRKRTVDDPNMPCFKGCPCFTTYEADFIATHPDFYRCSDFFDQQSEEQDQEIEVWGDIDAFGRAQTRGNVSTSHILPEPEVALIECNWDFFEDSSSASLGRSWLGDYFDEEDRQKYEDCRAIIEQTSMDDGLLCETDRECFRRIAAETPQIEDLFVEIDGYLVNDPPETCLNKDPISRIDWYWGDGSLDSFEEPADGFVAPFPNSHTYRDYGFYVVFIYAYDDVENIVSFTSRLLVLLGQ